MEVVKLKTPETLVQELVERAIEANAANFIRDEKGASTRWHEVVNEIKRLKPTERQTFAMAVLERIKTSIEAQNGLVRIASHADLTVALQVNGGYARIVRVFFHTEVG
jgi:hypothetical protein